MLKIREILLGKALDPLKSETRHSLALVAFLAWVGLGADGLSSSAYGPEESFRALGEHTHLGLYLALATALTVFIIALAYNQVIELFPTGGGGYRVATKLVGPYLGLVSGVALILDYVLTIAISVASGVDALASLLPLGFQDYKLWAEAFFVGMLIVLNLRGLKEAIRFLLPVFLGFVATHLVLIVYGIFVHAEYLPALVPTTLADTGKLTQQIGWAGVASMLLLAYSQGGGTYTGLEAVSNNVNMLAEPRVRTGKMTMLYMALSLAFTAGGIFLLYLLWDARHVDGETLNATTFRLIIDSMGTGNQWLNDLLLAVVLAFEAGLLFVAANTGFLGGPAVLSNMAADSWVPHKFRYLSTRLVTQNGILVMGIAALAILFWTQGSVTLLIVLYSISVFLTFAISLFGLCRYWWRQRRQLAHWKRRFLLSLIGFVICASILSVLLYEKMFAGGWATAVIIAGIAALCIYIRNHYRETKEAIRSVDQIFSSQPFGPNIDTIAPDPVNQTAVFIVGTSRGGGLHALLWVQRMFPGHFKNFIFVNARTVDSHAYGGEGAVEQMRAEANATLQFFVDFCRSHGMASSSYLGFGTDAVQEVTKLCFDISREYPNAIFFTSKLIFEQDNWFIRLLHNQAALAIQRRLHFDGLQMVILPMKV
ncbi:MULTISPECIES: APC family permease [unclassified Herbaspirillum]|uniref:APC family permease n=1 Tax=unclassified Herbaspirillum TaxID=2624150 RepID=UPI000E2F8096|nr:MULTISPECIES: APC family permease [unclassified Herbaspirillum]RFB69989.1 APC family permease [Herbaspirillum sp. 3R-3a1]TFI06944.1 APC family permease [Herbaspirillum sp. 3R11]TFI12882.1 APC family permease [Herbaspirillum sp. 3R-11]TFI27797.1 APC family permease [Herbaspirillum sp. 3C11]TFI27814.1 APC family permease [Herbaspirillum sp. 3C11]